MHVGIFFNVGGVHENRPRLVESIRNAKGRVAKQYASVYTGAKWLQRYSARAITARYLFGDLIPEVISPFGTKPSNIVFR